MYLLKYILLSYFLVLSAIHSLKAQESRNKQSVKSTQLFFDDFSKDVIGKSPSNWVSNVSGEIVTLKSYPGKWLKMHAGGTYLPQINQNLPDKFTIEFDFIYEALGTDYNVTEITLFSKKQEDTFDDFSPGNNGIKIFLENFIVTYACYNQQKVDDKTAMEHRTDIIQTNKKVTVNIEVNNQHVKLFVNHKELINATACSETPLQLNTIRFNLWGSQAEPLISNFCVTKQ